MADPSDELPVPREAGWLDESGRGLHVIASLSDQWGSCMARGRPGKVVWATFTTTQLSGLRCPGSRDAAPRERRDAAPPGLRSEKRRRSAEHEEGGSSGSRSRLGEMGVRVPRTDWQTPSLAAAAASRSALGAP